MVKVDVCVLALLFYSTAYGAERCTSSQHCCKLLTHKRFKRTLFIRTKHNMRISGVIPFIKYKTTLRQQLTPSLPWCHLKTTNKSAKFETLKPFSFLFRTGM